MHDEIAMLGLRRRLTEMVDHVAGGGSRLMVLRNGRMVAGLVSPTDLLALEKADAGSARFHDMMHEARMREFRFLRDGLRDARREAAENLPAWDRLPP